MAQRTFLKQVLMANEFGVDVPEHTLLSRLGRGGMAAVYLAREERLGRLVAIKVIDERFERDERFRRRFEREARTAASLTHPNIVPVYQYGFTTDERPYLTMAFLEDGSLRDRLFKHGALSVLEALSITRQIAAALQAAHARNIIHRDLKPDNVLFQQDMALLTDFGIAKVLGAGTALTAAGANPGTVRYFSPEQAREHPIDHRSDIYSLGVLLYEMLTGQVPIEGDTVVHLMVRIAQYPPKPLPVTLQGLQPLMDLLIAKSPADRLRSCADVISIIQAMERNWTRFGQVDRLSHGVSLRTTSAALPERHTLSAAPTQLVATPPPVHANALRNSSGAPDGHAARGCNAPEPAHVAAQRLHSTEVAGPSTSRAAARSNNAQNGANVHISTVSCLLDEQPPRSRAGRRTFVAVAATLAAVTIYAALVLLNSNSAAAIASSGERTAADTAIAKTERVAVRENAGANAVSATAGTTAGATGGVAMISRAHAGPGTRAATTPEQTAALNVQASPMDATVTLLDSDNHYQPGMRLPVGSVRIQIAKPGHITARRTVLVGPGVNNIAVTLDQVRHKRVAQHR